MWTSIVLCLLIDEFLEIFSKSFEKVRSNICTQWVKCGFILSCQFVYRDRICLTVLFLVIAWWYCHLFMPLIISIIWLRVCLNCFFIFIFARACCCCFIWLESQICFPLIKSRQQGLAKIFKAKYVKLNKTLQSCCIFPLLQPHQRADTKPVLLFCPQQNQWRPLLLLQTAEIFLFQWKWCVSTVSVKK